MCTQLEVNPQMFKGIMGLLALSFPVFSLIQMFEDRTKNLCAAHTSVERQFSLDTRPVRSLFEPLPARITMMKRTSEKQR